MCKSLLLVACATLVSGHFSLTWPTGRGFIDDTEPEYPCGGLNAVNSTRTQIPIGSPFPIQINNHHTQSLITVALAVGDAPTGDSFSHVLIPTVSEQGPQDFCFGAVVIPPTLPDGTTIAPGSNGTIQVQTNSDDASGLYQCADVTFVSQPLSQEDFTANCRNSTGVRVADAEPSAQGKSANGTAYGGVGGATSASPSGSASLSAPSQSATTGAAPMTAAPVGLQGLGTVTLIAAAAAAFGALLI